MGLQLRFAAGFAALLALAVPATAGEIPKRGGILNYVIPADAPLVGRSLRPPACRRLHPIGTGPGPTRTSRSRAGSSGAANRSITSV